MTVDEFNGTKWKLGMTAVYHNWKYNVVATNFAECLVALSGSTTDGAIWVRCENIELITNEKEGKDNG